MAKKQTQTQAKRKLHLQSHAKIYWEFTGFYRSLLATFNKIAVGLNFWQGEWVLGYCSSISFLFIQIPSKFLGS